jgi:hypothetical protein
MVFLFVLIIVPFAVIFISIFFYAYQHLAAALGARRVGGAVVLSLLKQKGYYWVDIYAADRMSLIFTHQTLKRLPPREDILLATGYKDDDIVYLLELLYVLAQQRKTAPRLGE